MRRMIFALSVWLGLGLAASRAEIAAPELVELPYRVVHDEMIFLRDKDDRRYSVWTDDPAKVPALLAGFNLGFDDLLLKKGEVLVVFLQDDITQVLTGVFYNKTARECFADYAYADIMLKIGPTPEGKKRSRLTVVIFTPPERPSHIGMRATVRGGLSEAVP
ncbi:hypothetical protein DB345_02225 [Spartobacteria bacterium LR76]|nr:hypothetical protein DB345_02225 [Spartobacteria bacterium LR76]